MKKFSGQKKARFLGTSMLIGALMVATPFATALAQNEWNINQTDFNRDVLRALSDFDKTTKTITPGTQDTEYSTFSLREAVELAISTNPEYGLLSSNKRATAKELEQAQALYRPSVDFAADAGVEYTDNPTGTSIDDEETLGRYDTSLTLTQMLYDGGGTFRENQRQKARVLSAKNRVREGAELIGLSVVEFYLEILRRRELLDVARQNIETHRDFLDDIRENARLGKASQADIIQVEARLEDALAAANNIKRDLEIARSNFKREVGARAYSLVPPQVPDFTLNTNVEQEVYAALQNSPTLSIFEADIKVAEEEMEAAKASLYPEVDFQMNARTGDNIAGIQGQDTDASALVVMNWNLYRGGGDTARIQEFKYRHSRQKEEYAQAARDVENEVRNTWADLQAARQRMMNFQRQSDANDKLVDAYEDQFLANRRTLLDVLDVQNELFISSSAAINEKYLAQFSTYRLLSLKGELLTSLDVNIPERL